MIYAALYTPDMATYIVVHLTYYPGAFVSRAVKIFISAFFAGSFVRNNISVLPRVLAKRTPKRTSKRKLKKICTLAEPCYYSLAATFAFSLISELSRGFAAMPTCYGVNGLFCLF